MRIYNSLSRKVEEFQPLTPNQVSIYCCGPTVYDFTHIGHLFKYIMDDTIVRTFRHFGYSVKHARNITDVGHLVSDADTGEDKLEKGAKKTGKTVWEVAKFYTEYFDKSMQLVGVYAPDFVCKATDHIFDMIEVIKTLEQKGYTYETSEAIYFDTSKFEGYGQLAGQKLDEKHTAVRDEVVEDSNKKNPSDFVLWFKRVGKFADHLMHWTSPWGEGFPGWHIECSAMSMKYLGPQIDIHTGGIDHIAIHHPNEIAQSEASSGKSPFVRYWIHHNFVKIEGAKMSKSLGNFLTIDDIINKNFDPYALRLLFLQTHYRNESNFTWDALAGASVALKKLQNIYSQLPQALTNDNLSSNPYYIAFDKAISDDFNFAKAVGIMWEVVKSDLDGQVKRGLIDSFNQVLGLNIKPDTNKDPISDEAKQLMQARHEAKLAHDYALADSLREQISKIGYAITDDKDGNSSLSKV